MTTKEKILEAIGDLPDDATIEQAMERLYLLYRFCNLKRGLADIEAGRTLSQEGLLRSSNANDTRTAS